MIEFLSVVVEFIEEKEYYERQFATLKSFEEVDTLMETNTIDEEDDEEQVEAEKAMKISNYANVLLLVFKVTWPMLVFEILELERSLLIACSNVSFIQSC